MLDGRPPLVNIPKIGDIAYYYNFNRGLKLFELTNHLGNVLATVTDTKIPVNNGNTISYYTANLVNATEYAPGGMTMLGRSFIAANNSAYRYGFNGKEKDPNITSEDYDYGFRIYDARVVRFLSVDPLTKKYPELTPYQFSSNNPIWNIDIDGLEGTHYTDPKQMLYEAGGDISEAMANVADKFSAKLEAGYTFFKQLFSKGNTTVSAERTTTVSAGFTPNTKSFISYVKATNTSQGAPPLFNIELDKTTSTAAVTKVKMANVTQTYTMSQDSKGVFKADVAINYATSLWGIPADITGNVSKKSSGENAISGGFTLKATDNIKFPMKINYTQSPDGTKKVSEKVGSEVKVGDKSGVKVFGNLSMEISN